MPSDFPEGLALLLEWLDYPDRRASAPRLPRDWDHFAHLLHRHRVTRRVAGALAKAGVSLPASIAQTAKAKALAAMQQVAEADLVHNALYQAGIPSLMLKGAVLSQTLYGDPTLRESKDIDLLVRREHFADALRVLCESLDYSCATPPPLDTARAQIWLDGNKDIALSAKNGMQIELHHRLTGIEPLLPTLGLDQATESVTIGLTSFAQFDRANLFTYLSVHGAASRWHRLTWIADVRAMLASASQSEFEHFHAVADGHGVGRCALAAMVLCDRLWGQPLPTALNKAAARDSRVEAIVANSLTTLTDPNYIPATAKGRASISNALLLRDDKGYRRAVMKDWMTDPAMLSEVALPRPLWPLYVPLRFALWVKRKIAGQRL